jgi:hypothetical protein
MGSPSLLPLLRVRLQILPLRVTLQYHLGGTNPRLLCHARGYQCYSVCHPLSPLPTKAD